MIINNIKAKNFKLFKELDLSLEKINLIIGENKDDIENSSNGSGKSSILEAILFGLWGEVTDINLKDLIRIGTRETEVQLTLNHNNKNTIISRKVPSSLSINEDGKELQFNTASLAQKYLNDLFGSDFLHYRTYNLIDNKKGINLLDLGITSLRKALMDFVNAQFITVRQSLLAKKLERETFNVNKRLYTFYLSTKRQTLLESGLLKLQEELTSANNDYSDQYKVVNNYKSEISSREKIIYYKNQELKKVDEGICPVLKIKCEKITPKNKTPNLGMTKEIDIIKGEITEITNLLQSEESCMQNCYNGYEFIQKRVQRTKEYLMKLKEAQKFAAYKYTKEDVQLYADSVKILDSFSSYYITEWLSNLQVIINDLLKGLNLSVEFSVDKDFIKIDNNGQILNYSQLSSGQKKFLGTIFKIGILLQEGIHEGVLLFDEGLGDIDSVNFYKLIEILKGLNFQNIIIYQNVDKSIQDVNFINAERKEGTSTIK